MAALGGAIIFFYTSWTAFKISQGLERIVGLMATIFSSIFILLFSYTNVTGFLSNESIVALVVWSILGFVLYKMNSEGRSSYGK